MFGSRCHELILEYFQRYLTGTAEDILDYIMSKPVKAPANHRRTRKRSPGVTAIGAYLRPLADIIGKKRVPGRKSKNLWKMKDQYTDPRSHNVPFTYKPKIEAVKNGSCKQTIRVMNKRKKRAGDSLYLYGWAGKPYRSIWAWRRVVTCSSAIDIEIFLNGILFIDRQEYVLWSQLDDLAEEDHIYPPTGKELGRVIISKNGGIPMGGAPGQIIRWG